MLDRIPPEILDRILLLCDPIDIARLLRLSKFLYRYIYPNNNLWRRIFLSYFDDPFKAKAVIRCAFETHESSVKISHRPTRIDWFRTLQQRIILRQTLSVTQSPLFIHRLEQHYSGNRLESLYQLILLVLYTARAPQHSSCTSYPNPIYSNFKSYPAHSRNLLFLHDLLHNPTTQLHLFQLPAIQTKDPSTRIPRLYGDNPDLATPAQWAPAKLHTVFGITDFDSDCPRTRALARERSYAVANYSGDCLYGPFLPLRSTQVNWCHLRDLSLVVGLNLYNICRSQHDSPDQRPPSNPLPNLPMNPPAFTMPNPYHLNLLSPNITPRTDQQRGQLEKIDWPILSSLQSAIPYTQPSHSSYLHPTLSWPPSVNRNGHEDLNRYDWAGVTGRWLRVVCYIHYMRFRDYNFGGSTLTLDEVNDMVRSMTLDLEVVSIRDPPNDSHPIPLDLRTDLDHRPPIFFKGTLVYNEGVSTQIAGGQDILPLRGCVSMTIDDEVRWSMVSTIKGADKWASEGIQVGGVQSRWGVVGAWTDVDREQVAGPVGPFYFFKISC